MQEPKFVAAAFKVLQSDQQELGDDSFGYKRPMKRNSELLNSLLGLPKNILKSGKK